MFLWFIVTLFLVGWWHNNSSIYCNFEIDSGDGGGLLLGMLIAYPIVYWAVKPSGSIKTRKRSPATT